MILVTRAVVVVAMKVALSVAKTLKFLFHNVAAWRTARAKTK